MKNKSTLLPVSQRELASYLGVSHSLLSMTNSWRYGDRQLGGGPSKKMTDLLLAHVKAQEPHIRSGLLKKMLDPAADGSARLADKLLSDADYADAHAGILEDRLADMVTKYQQDRQWMNTIKLLLSTLPATEETVNDCTWLANQQVVVSKRIQRNGLPAQVKLEVQIEIEKARGRVYRNAREKLMKKTP